MLKVKKIRKKKNETHEEFFIRFFNILPETYELDGTLQCKKGKLRTYNDLYRVYQYYYPNTHEDHFVRMLRELIKKHIINVVYCRVVNDFTFFVYAKHYTYAPLFVAVGFDIHFNEKGVFPDRYCSYDSNSQIRAFLAKMMVTIPEYHKGK